MRSRPVRNAFTNGELEQPADAVEVRMDSRDYRERLGIDGALELGASETAPQDLSTRATRLLGERVESREVVLVDSEGRDASLPLFPRVPLPAPSFPFSGSSTTRTPNTKLASFKARVRANSGGPSSTCRLASTNSERSTSSANSRSTPIGISLSSAPRRSSAAAARRTSEIATTPCWLRSP